MRGHVSDICEPESPKGVFKISDDPVSAREGACLRYDGTGNANRQRRGRV